MYLLTTVYNLVVHTLFSVHINTLLMTTIKCVRYCAQIHVHVLFILCNVMYEMCSCIAFQQWTRAKNKWKYEISWEAYNIVQCKWWNKYTMHFLINNRNMKWHKSGRYFFLGSGEHTIIWNQWTSIEVNWVFQNSSWAGKFG